MPHSRSIRTASPPHTTHASPPVSVHDPFRCLGAPTPRPRPASGLRGVRPARRTPRVAAGLLPAQALRELHTCSVAPPASPRVHRLPSAAPGRVLLLLKCAVPFSSEAVASRSVLPECGGALTWPRSGSLSKHTQYFLAM